MTIGVDVAAYLADSGYGALGTDIFLGYIPDTQNAIIITETGGFGPYLGMGDDTIIIRPTFQIIVRNESYITGAERISDIRTRLATITNTAINGNSYLYIRSSSGIAHIGRIGTAGGETNEFSTNFVGMREV